MRSTALVTAGVAAVLLVVVLGVDVAMTTTYAVDVSTDGAWREIGREPLRDDYGYHFAQTTVSANASDDVTFRLRVDNGYPWERSFAFRVLHNGAEVASGEAKTGARATSDHEFTIPAERLLDGPGSFREPQAVGGPVYVYLEVLVDGKQVFERAPPSFAIEEAGS